MVGRIAKLSITSALVVGVWAGEARAGATTSKVVEPGSANLVGQVLDAQGSPLAGARVRLVRITDSSVFVSRPANRRGEFRLESLPGGRYAVQVLWARTRQVYPWIGDLEIGPEDTVRQILRIRPPFPEPYPGEAAWAEWSAAKSDIQ